MKTRAIKRRKPKRQRRDEPFMVRLNGAEKADLHRLAAASDVPAAQLLRQLLKTLVAEAGALDR